MFFLHPIIRSLSYVLYNVCPSNLPFNTCICPWKYVVLFCVFLNLHTWNYSIICILFQFLYNLVYEVLFMLLYENPVHFFWSLHHIQSYAYIFSLSIPLWRTCKLSPTLDYHKQLQWTSCACLLVHQVKTLERNCYIIAYTHKLY